MRKYGSESFVIESIYESKDINHTLNVMEPYFISEYNTFEGIGYNMTPGGDKPPSREGTVGPFKGKKRNWKHTDESKQKLSKQLTGRKLTAAQCQQISNRQKGKPHPTPNRKAPYTWIIEHPNKEIITVDGKNLKEFCLSNLIDVANLRRGKTKGFKVVVKVKN